MPNWEKEGKESEARAEEALKISWLSLKFSRDTLAAAIEYNSAASSYASAKNFTKTVDCLSKVRTLKLELGDNQGAGRACEEAAKIEEKLGNIDSALKLWELGVSYFRLADKGDLAIRLLLKSADVCAKQAALHRKVPNLYDEALSIQEDSSQLYSSPEVYRNYQSFLLRTKEFKKLFAVMDRHIAVLTKLKQMPFVYREILSKVVVICCALRRTVRAEEVMNDAIDVSGWLASNEFAAAEELIDAVHKRDAGRLTAAKKHRSLNSLHIDVIRVLKSFELQPDDSDIPDLC